MVEFNVWFIIEINVFKKVSNLIKKYSHMGGIRFNIFLKTMFKLENYET